VSERRFGACQRKPDDIKDAQLRRRHHIAGQVVERQSGYPCRQLRRQRCVGDDQRVLSRARGPIERLWRMRTLR
jgi:hypothetical protein